jgi:hypothetical protein
LDECLLIAARSTKRNGCVISSKHRLNEYHPPYTNHRTSTVARCLGPWTTAAQGALYANCHRKCK